MPPLGVFRSQTAGLDRDVVLLSVASFVVMLGSSVISPVLPLYAREFGVSYGGAGLLISAFALGRLLFDYVGGALADRVSPRTLTASGALLTSTAAFLSANATSFAWLVAFRTLEGVGSAFFVVTVMAIFARTVAPERMGKAMSFYQSMILLGVSFGPTVGGVVAELAGGLRAPFYVMGVFGLGVVAMSIAVVRDDLPAGAGGHGARPSLRAVVRHSRSRTFVYVLVLTFVVFAIRAGTRVNLIPLYGGERGGLGASALGCVRSASAFSNFAVLWHAGGLLDRRGRQRVALPALAATSVLCAAFALSPGFWNLFAVSLLVGVAFGYLAPAPAAMAADVTPREMMGSVIGVYRMAGDVGLLLGPVALGEAATRFGFEAAFLLSALAAAGALALGLGVPETLGARAAAGPRAANAGG